MFDYYAKYFAGVLLLFMLGMAFYSMIENTATFDEVAHLPAGYSYITQKDMRLNPEHPPLVKDIAALPILIWSKISKEPINVPTNIPAWTDEVNGQWTFGNAFLYGSDNPSELMLFLGHLPMLLILFILGIYLFIWTKQLWGAKAALLALFLFSFSPTFIAHSQFVTTDVAAAAGFFIALYYFIKWLKNPTTTNMVLAGIVFGLVQLIKFSLFLIIPLFGFLTILWIIIRFVIQKKPAVPEKPEPPAQSPISARIFAPQPKPDDLPQLSLFSLVYKYIGGFILICLVGYALVVVPVYSYHVANYPAQKQASDISAILNTSGSSPESDLLSSCKDAQYLKRCPREITIWMAGKFLPFRAFAQYVYGVLMMLQRASGGNTTYFLGEISAAGWSSYFPIMYLAKEPIPLHILTLAALAILLYFSTRKRDVERIGVLPEARLSAANRAILWLNRNFESVAMLSFLALYWYTSVSSPLNIGVRHILPTFAFTFALVASQIVKWLRTKKEAKKSYLFLKYGVTVFLLAWQAISVMAVYPHFLAYYNEAAGGPKNGYKIATDSNLDWGQDLGRLAKWAKDNNIEKIYVDYFGGAPPNLYLGEKYRALWENGKVVPLNSGDWIAVSANSLQGGRAKAVNGYDKPTDYYNWINQYEPPKTVIGYSIFVYQIR